MAGMTPRLSRREMEVARLVAEGLSDRQIASRLFISERTAEGHLQQIRNKLGLDTRAQVAVWVTSLSMAAGAAGGPVEGEQAAPVRPNNLPVQLTTFIGRERDITEVRRLLNRSRLVTITGPGGSGKTRLAVQAAVENLYRYQDGAWFVDLSPITDPNSLPQAVASVLAVHEREQTDLISAIGLHLTSNWCRVRCLVILDNCEQVVEGCAGM